MLYDEIAPTESVDHVTPAAYYEYNVVNEPTAPPVALVPMTPTAPPPPAIALAPEAPTEQHHVSTAASTGEWDTKKPVTDIVVVGPQAMRVVCPHCKAELMTKTKCRNSTRTHLMSVLFGITTCLWCMPYFFKSYKNIHHYCSACGMYLGTFYH